jgi:hypothetical protein
VPAGSGSRRARGARWAAQPVELGGPNRFAPLVLRPSGLPEVTDKAHADPELAVLSAMAHGKNTSIDTTVRITMAAHSAIAGLDEDRSKLYYDW